MRYPLRQEDREAREEADAQRLAERAMAPLEDRIVELEADIANTLKAILFHFGPDGAKKVTDMVIEQRAKGA